LLRGHLWLVLELTGGIKYEEAFPRPVSEMCLSGSLDVRFAFKGAVIERAGISGGVKTVMFLSYKVIFMVGVGVGVGD